MFFSLPNDAMKEDFRSASDLEMGRPAQAEPFKSALPPPPQKTGVSTLLPPPPTPPPSFILGGEG